MTIPRPFLICGFIALSAALTIGVQVTQLKRGGTRSLLAGEPQMVDFLKMGSYAANIELIQTPDGARAIVARRTEADNESGSAPARAPDTFIVR